MHIELTPHEARVIGCLIEKEITTPEQYPLSLNALVNACNQKSNREPVLELDETAVQQTVDSLVGKFLVSAQTGYGSRVAKYRHRLCNTEYGTLKFSPQELGIVCELLLRGPQTPGELRSRASRLCHLTDVTDAEAALEHLASRADGPFVMRLPREPGKRESRYTHLFGGTPDSDTTESPPVPAHTPAATQLEERVEKLEAEMAAIKSLLAAMSQSSAQHDKLA